MESVVEVSVRELSQKLEGYLERAHNGERVLVTRQGRAYAEIGPPGPSTQPVQDPEDIAARLRALPGVTWSGRTLSGFSRPVRLSGKGPTVAEMIVKARR